MTAKTGWTRALPAAAAALGALVLGACGDEDPVVDLTEARPILRMILSPGEMMVPFATAELGSTRITGFDLGVTDGFARGEGPDEFYVAQNWGGGTFPGFDVHGGVRNSSEDGRRPALRQSEATPGGWYGLWPPPFAGRGEGAWNLWGVMTGLEPNTTYTVVLARMALHVNGELDQHEILTGRDMAEPDSLYFLGGAPAGYPDITCNFGPTSPVTAATNPVALGSRTTDGEGTVEFDCVPLATGDSPWWRNAATASPPGFADSIPVGSNAPGGSVGPGQFNYLLIYEGVGTDDNPIPPGPPTVRVQLGADIDENGNVINNSFRPFPTEITDLGAFRTLPGGGDAIAAPGDITLDLTRLPAISGRVYHLWLYSRSDGSYAPAPARITIGEDDPFVGATFTSPGEDAEITATLDDAATGLDFGQFTHVVVSHESGEGTSPSDTRFLFHEYLMSDLSLASGGLTFGSFDPPSSRTFTAGGGGTGAFLRDSLIVRLTAIPAPPQGFHYQSYLVNFQGPVVQGTPLRLNTVTLDASGNGEDRIGAGQLGASGFQAFGEYNTYLLLLEPDGAPTFTRMQVQASEDYVSKFTTFFNR